MFPKSKMTKMTLTKMTACYVFSELFLCGVRTSHNFAITKSEAIWNRCGALNITRWLQWNYYPLLIASCKVISKPFCQQNAPCCIRNLVVRAGCFIAFCWPSSPSFLSVAPPMKTPFMRSWGGILTSLKVFFRRIPTVFHAFHTRKMSSFHAFQPRKTPHFI